jgi:predicted nucleotidyltransferase
MKVNKEALFKNIISLIKKHGAKKIAVFGLYSRGEEKPKSDIDILVEFSERKSLLDIVGIEQELSDALGMKVDLLTEKSISPYLIGRIKKEMKVIYE